MLGTRRFLTRHKVCRLHKLKVDVIHAMETCRKPKYRILLEGAFETLCKCCGRAMVFHDEHSDVEHGRANTDDEHSPLLSPTGSDAAPDESDDQVDVPDATMAPLFPPGRIIHIVDTLTAGPGKRQLEAYWASANSFNRVVACPDMISDHLPNVLLKAMEAVWKEKRSSPTHFTRAPPSHAKNRYLNSRLMIFHASKLATDRAIRRGLRA